MTTKTDTEAIRSSSTRRGRNDRYKWMFLSVTVLAVVLSTILIFRQLAKDYEPKDCVTGKNCGTGAKPNYESLTSRHCREACGTKSCLKTAAYILERMDPNYEPCEDFYMYSCGNFQKLTLGEEILEISFFTMMEDIFRGLKNIVEDSPETEEKDGIGSSFNKVKDLYDSCMETSSTEETAIPTLKKYFEKFGLRDWPFLKPDFRFVDIYETFAELHMYGMDTFFDVYVGSIRNQTLESSRTEGTNSSSEQMPYKIRQTWRTAFSEGGNITEEDKKEAKIVLEKFDVPSDLGDAIVENLMKFDQEFSNITESARIRQHECGDEDCSSLTIDCKAQPLGHWKKWCKVLNLILQKSGVPPAKRYLHIYANDEKYFEQLYVLLSTVNHSDLGHYIAFEALDRHEVYMNYKIRGNDAEQNDKVKTRWKFCISKVLQSLPMILGAKYYDLERDDTKYQEAGEIFQELKESFLNILQRNSWIDEGLRGNISKEVEGINITSEAYIREVSNFTIVDEYFQKLEITKESFLANAMEIQRFRTSQFFLNTPQLEIHNKNPFAVTAGYDGEEIRVEIGFFVFPMLMSMRPSYTNFGMFGFVLGHELGHIVERGLRFHENRSERFESIFSEKFNCIADQYSEFEIDVIKVKVDGNKTFGDNMADQIGTKAAFQAFKRYQKMHGTENQLPGLLFSDEQMFFLSLAQIWCEKPKLAALENYKEDEHSPSKFRIVGTFRNLEEFSEAFRCPVGSRMNPEEKCIVVT